jgi:phosphohistidine phosphatase SixA
VRCPRRLQRSGRVAMQPFTPLTLERLGLVSAVEATTSPYAEVSEACSYLRTCIAGCHCLLVGGHEALLFACWRTKYQRQAAEAESVSGIAGVQSATVVMKCRRRRGCSCNTDEARPRSA